MKVRSMRLIKGSEGSIALVRLRVGSGTFDCKVRTVSFNTTFSRRAALRPS